MESTEAVDVAGPSRSSWNCDHWIAYGTHGNREIRTRACTSQIEAPTAGDRLEVVAAPRGAEAYLLARGDPNGPLKTAAAWTIAAAIAYGLALSARLLYIGYSSNWRRAT